MNQIATVLPTVSCIMPTFRRFNCVERSISMYLAQDYQGPMELIIYNTDVEHPLSLGESFKDYKVRYPNHEIRIFNCDTDAVTNQPFTSTGAIRRDSADHAMGDWYICWDDDDIFLPWNVRQCVDKVLETGRKAWKPHRSFALVGGVLSCGGNYLEATVIVRMDEIKGKFLLEAGKEHMGWYHKLQGEGQLREDSSDSIPGYCFNWGDPGPMGGHKQSSTINDPDNFNLHKRMVTDIATRPLEIIDLKKVYHIYYDELVYNKNQFHYPAWEKYALPHIGHLL
jgi:hypothetical protein